MTVMEVEEPAGEWDCREDEAGGETLKAGTFSWATGVVAAKLAGLCGMEACSPLHDHMMTHYRSFILSAGFRR